MMVAAETVAVMVHVATRWRLVVAVGEDGVVGGSAGRDAEQPSSAYCAKAWVKTTASDSSDRALRCGVWPCSMKPPRRSCATM